MSIHSVLMSEVFLNMILILITNEDQLYNIKDSKYT